MPLMSDSSHFNPKSGISSKYQDLYYNHFSKKHSKTPPQFHRDENFMMRFKTKLPHYKYDENSLTIIYFNQGFGDLIFKDKKIKVNGDKFIVSNPGDGWEYLNKDKKCIDVLSFAISDNLIGKFNFFAHADEDQLLNVPFERMNQKSFFIEQTYSAALYKSGKLLKSIYEVSNKCGYEFTDPKEITIEMLQAIYSDQFKLYQNAQKIKVAKKSTQIETMKRLLTVYEYIHDHIEQKISIEELSIISALSEYHLYNSFKRIFGKTPYQYINMVKMNKAKQYLEKGDLSVSEIARIFDFPDLSSFSKLFKKTYGCAPTKFMLRY